ncbi:MAG: hypothetical protein WBO04_02765 [Steroidobacteraceae bacterium]
MTSEPTPETGRYRALCNAVGTCLLLALLTACAARPPGGTASAPSTAAPATPAPGDLGPYLETLSRMAPGDAARQQAEVAATLAAAQQSRSWSNTLRYALALGSPGHAGSNPVEARRLIVEVLAGPNDLKPHELAFASAYLRELDARVALYADLARQREESEQKLRSHDATADRRADSLAAENARLKKALAEAERKLKAVEEMERALLEQASESESEAPPQR